MDLAYWTCKEDGYWFHWEKESPQWNDIRTELEMLDIEGKAERVGDSYVISHDVAASFSRDERELLTLPAVFPYRFSIDKESVLQDKEFHFRVHFLKGDGTYFINPEVIGSLIRINKELQYMCNTAQYNILQIVKMNRNDMTDRNEILSYNMRHLAKVKENAEAVEAKLDAYLEQTHVVTADQLSVSVQKAKDGSYFVCPVLLQSDGTPIEPQAENDFAKKFHRLSKVKPVYQGTNRTYYVFDKEQTEGLEEIKEKKHLNTQEAREIMKAPYRVFKSKTFNFNQEDYSDRVVGYDVYIPQLYPYIKATQGEWLPPEGSTDIETENISLEAPPIESEDIGVWEDKIVAAEKTGATYVEHDGKKYAVPQVKRAIEAHKSGVVSTDRSTKWASGVDEPESIENKELLIEDNIELLGYQKSTEKERNRRALKRESIAGREFYVSQISSGLLETIRPFSYQKDGMEWMAKNWLNGYKGVLLADDMGLGKTLQTLGFLSGLKMLYRAKDMPSVLIVAPVSLLSNWKSEYEKFVRPDVFADVVSLYGNQLKDMGTNGGMFTDLSPVAYNHIVLTSYETLRRYDTSFGKVEWSAMVLDEAQKVKNPASLISNCVRAMKYDFGIALTGTPVENAWVDLWSIMDFVEPGRLQDLKGFCETYQNQLKKLHGDVKAIEELGEKLEGELQPVFLRRQKADYLEGLPKKYVDRRPMPMPVVQRQAYQKIISYGNSCPKKKGQIFKIIAALRDVSLCPYLGTYNDEAFVTMKPVEFFSSSARLQALYQALVQIKLKKEKVLIFVTSKKMQRILKHFLEIAFAISIQPPINGELQGEIRQKIVDTFNPKEGFAILILSAEAGGVGFNITAANHVIHLSRCWNPAKEDQATDRVYRIGQQKEVHVYLPMATWGDGSLSTFDEKLDQLLEFKRSLSKSVVFPTEDSAEDGYQIWNELFPQAVAEPTSGYGMNASYWTISDMDRVKGEVFEYIISKLYNAMPGCSAVQTPIRNDYGADVVVSCDAEKRKGLLIQCKQTASNKKMSPEGVEQICSAIPLYEKQRGYSFQGVVITNAPDFTENAKVRAHAAGVKLISRAGLMKLLEKYRIEKDWNF